MKSIIKNTTKLLALAALLTTGLSSCSEDFLDREPQGGSYTTGQLSESMKWNTKILLGQMQGVTTNMVRWQSGGTTNQDDFGQKSVDIATDLMSGDMVFSRCNYGWFMQEAQLNANTFTRDRAYILWRHYFRVINTCNQILDAAGGDQAEPENATNKLYFAVAKTVRAHSYFNLVTLYAKNYDEAKDTKALPVYRSQEVDGFYAPPQTVDSVYNFIIEDLTEAIGTYERAAEGGATPSDISTPDVSVAWTVLAYAYLQKGDNANAETAAVNAISASNKHILTGEDEIFSGFNTIKNQNWMWGVDIDDQSTGGLCTFWGMMDYFTYSYQAAGDYKVINYNLFQEIPQTDVRREWFTGFGENPTYLMPALKFFDAAQEPMGDATWTNDIHFMRIEEPYLIAAEAAARQGQLDAARELLGYLLAERDPAKAQAILTMSQDELLEEIRYNWRVEFFAEGRGLLTQKRFKATNVRGANDCLLSNQEIPYNDSRLTFEVPQSEQQSNPYFSQK